MKLKYYPHSYLKAVAEGFASSILCNFRASKTRCIIRIVYQRSDFKDKETMRDVVFPLLCKTLQEKATLQQTQRLRDNCIIVKFIAIQKDGV